MRSPSWSAASPTPCPTPSSTRRPAATPPTSRRLGVRPGDHVGLLGPTSRPLVTAIQAVWLAGATVVVLPLPMRMGSIEEFVDQTRARIANADVVAGARRPGAGPVRRAGRRATRRWSAGTRSRPARAAPPPRTGCARRRPRPARHPAVHQRVDVRPEGRDAPAPHGRRRTSTPSPRPPRSTPTTTSSSRGCRCTTTWASSGSSRLGSPRARRSCSARPPTSRRAPAAGWSGSPPTAARPPPGRTSPTCSPPAPSGRGDVLDLSRLRIALNGAEPVDPATVAKFVEAGARHGLRPGAVFPAFGMAEVAIAGTFPEPMSGLRTDAVDRRVLEAERYAAPVDPDHERRPPPGHPRPARPGPRDPGRRPRHRRRARRSARSASSRSGAPR